MTKDNASNTRAINHYSVLDGITTPWGENVSRSIFSRSQDPALSSTSVYLMTNSSPRENFDDTALNGTTESPQQVSRKIELKKMSIHQDDLHWSMTKLLLAFCLPHTLAVHSVTNRPRHRFEGLPGTTPIGSAMMAKVSRVQDKAPLLQCSVSIVQAKWRGGATRSTN